MNENDPLEGSYLGGSYLGGSYMGRNQSPEIEHEVCDEWIKILKVLLEEKFIYQNVCLNADVFARHADDKHSQQALSDEFSKRATYPLSDGKTDKVRASPDWMISGASNFEQWEKYEEQPLPFYLPALQLHCKECKGERSFGSLIDSRSGYLQAFLNKKQKPDVNEQVYTFYYLCGSCSNRTIVFQVVRTGLKLQLTGRSEPLRPAVGKWPKGIDIVVEDAVQAVAENDIYGGFYHLRTAVEHYLKGQLGIDVSERKRGEELVDEYKKTLDEKVRTAAPSLSTVITEFSECLHSRTGDLSVFNDNLKKFEAHITMKKMIEDLAPA